MAPLAVARMEEDGQGGPGNISAPRPSAWRGSGSLKHATVSDLQLTPSPLGAP